MRSLIPFRRKGRRSRGQSLVEFAIILPVFLLFFAAVLDLGRIAAAQVTLTNAAREGAFQAADTPGDSAAVIGRVKREVKGSPVTVQDSDVAVSCSPSCANAMGNRVTVAVAGKFRLLTPIMMVFVGGSQDVTFSARATQQIEALPSTSSAPSITPSPSPSPSPSGSPAPTPTPAPCGIPSAGFTWSVTPSSKKAPVTVSVVDTSTSPGCSINTWVWSWGDGSPVTTGKLQSPHIYWNPGTYDITLTVTNATTSNTSGKVSITVKP